MMGVDACPKCGGIDIVDHTEFHLPLFHTHICRDCGYSWAADKNGNDKWDARFYELAAHIARWSKDPSTKCGAVITRGKFIVSIGFNGFPAGCLDDDSIYNDRPRKYARVIHAEKNAIFSAKQNLENCTIYVYPFPPCAQCAAAIVQVGIKRVVTKKATPELLKRWGDSIGEALSMFNEAGVEINYK